MVKKKIALIFGGKSPEYEVSLQSAAAVFENADKSRWDMIPLGINKEGKWFLCRCSGEDIAADRWEEAGAVPAMISPNATDRGILAIEKGKARHIPVDAALPILHGKYGEDGCVQGLCALGGIPMAGCGVAASAIAMDKFRAHMLAEAAGIRIARGFVVDKSFDQKEIKAKIAALDYPIFIKPLKAGSSFGISRIDVPEQISKALEKAFCYCDELIVEECIPGFEVGCAVMGNEELFTGEPDEIELSEGFFDYDEKYKLISSRIHVPARLSPQKRWEIKETAKLIYRALGCRGFARVDMFLTPHGELVFNEVNTIPGFTAHSRFPGMMQAVGIDFTELISRIIELAVEQ